MDTFYEWLDSKPLNENLNESNNLTDLLRDRLGSSAGYLKQVFNINETTEAPTQQTKSTPKPAQKNEEIASLEEKIKKGLDKAWEEAISAKKQKEETKFEPMPDEVFEQELVEEVEPNSDYKLYRDKEETFECNISIEGAGLSAASCRIIIDTAAMNLMFYGKLYKDGRCLVQLSKMSMLPEGTRGRIRLEVIVDDTLFSPWESSCIVEGSKKVFVDVKQKKNVSINFG